MRRTANDYHPAYTCSLVAMKYELTQVNSSDLNPRLPLRCDFVVMNFLGYFWSACTNFSRHEGVGC